MATPKDTAPSEVFVTEHSVGPHGPGEVIYFTEEHVKAGVDKARLLALNAIRKVEGKEAENALPYGTTPDPALQAAQAAQAAQQAGRPAGPTTRTTTTTVSTAPEETAGPPADTTTTENA